MVLSLLSAGSGSTIASAQQAGTSNVTAALQEMPKPAAYYTASILTISDGKQIKKHSINGAPNPPPGFEKERQLVALPKSDSKTTELIGLPGSIWLLGCSSGAAADIAALYDQPTCYPIIGSNMIAVGVAGAGDACACGWTNLYAGPTNSGVMPLNSNPWPTWKDVTGATYANNPLVASHQGVDGRSIRGTIDDYWVSYESGLPDPYITGGWSQHTWGDAIGDYMYTSQSAYGNDDGETSFWVYQTLAEPLTCDVMAANSLPDGTLGRKNFYEARGYSVGDCYNQPTDNAMAGGF